MECFPFKYCAYVIELPSGVGQRANASKKLGEFAYRIGTPAEFIDGNFEFSLAGIYTS
jgi:hypothetical protein